ncbi:MAG: hypothetical protein K8E66_12490, partial [Phycisphaerales bacterium]|nr:hypothetical protein [Phycisphaerales bacterium]
MYATFATDPGTISFDANDHLYVGNFNNPGPPNGPATVWVVDAVDSSVSACATVDDPDAVYVDRNGLLSSPGSILVGGWDDPTSIGQITAVAGGCGGQG